MRVQFYLFSLVLLLMSKVAFAQKDTNHRAGIKVIARVQKGDITLRWAASNALGWKYANEYGYMVERYTLVKRGKTLSKPKLLKITQEPIKPDPLEKWEAVAKKDKYGAIAAQALYGKSFEINTKAPSVMQLVNQSKELETRFSFALFCADQSLEVANLAGLKLTDKYIFKGERYLYKVYANIPKNVYSVDTGYVFVDADKVEDLRKPANVKAEFSDRTAVISWDNIYDEFYSSYFIERSDDGGATYKTINSDPYLNTYNDEAKKSNKIFYLDSLPENNKTYFYRIKGRSYFAEFGPVSEAVYGKGVDIPKASPQITGAKVIDNKEVLLSWEFPQEMDKKIKGFYLYKATTLNGQAKKMDELLASDKREVLIKDAKTSNYYYVKAVDAVGNEYSSTPYLVQLKDNTPPEAPLGLKGNIDTLGIIKLKWKAGKEEDIEGYRVYKANSLNDEFTLVSKAPVKDTIFMDSTIINTLSEKIYYKLVAIDHHFNISKFSKILTLKRPDKVAPASPVITDCIASDSGITVKWIPSKSSDVVKHSILRRVEGTDKWQNVISFDSTKRIRSYTDKSTDKKTVFEYTVAAWDESNNKAEALQSIKAKRLDNFIRPGIEKIKISADRENRNITVKWEYPEKGVRSFQIYRAEEGKLLKLYKTLSGENFIFVDTSIKMATKYIYVLKANLVDGGSSPFSREVEIEY